MAYFPELIMPSLGNKEVPYILTFTAFRRLEGGCDVAVEKVSYSDKVYENPARGAQEKIILPVPFPSMMTTAQFLLPPFLRKNIWSDENIQWRKVTDDA